MKPPFDQYTSINKQDSPCSLKLIINIIMGEICILDSSQAGYYVTIIGSANWYTKLEHDTPLFVGIGFIVTIEFN